MNTNEFRHIVGHFATGVTVVTSNVDGQMHGMTANAFASLSLDPLLLLVCVDREATCFAQVRAAGAFGINILARDQEGVSNTFARRLKPVQPDPAESEALLFGSAFELDEHGVPLLLDCLARFSCALHQVLDGGDHGIFVGRVQAGAVRRPDAAPLLYYGGRYAALES